MSAARNVMRIWFGRRRPGHPVVLRGRRFEIERVWGRGGGFISGERMRRDGWQGPRLDRVRLHVPWPCGALLIMER